MRLYDAERVAMARVIEYRGRGRTEGVGEREYAQGYAPAFQTMVDYVNGSVRSCYLHACLKYVARDSLTNASLRDRFGVRSNNKAMVSRYIREAVDAGMIRPLDEQAPPKMRRYVPFWAASAADGS